MKRAIIYARVSSVGDRQSTERQVADLTRFAQSSGLEIIKIYEEHISGAKKNEERDMLKSAISYSLENQIDIILVSELSRIGRNAFEVLSAVKEMIDAGIDIYFQKEQFHLLDADGKPSIITPVMIATLATCAQLERDNITFRLNSGRQRYIENGGRVGRKVGSLKSREKKAAEYAQLIRELRRGTSIRHAAKIYDVSVSTAQRIKKEFIT